MDALDIEGAWIFTPRIHRNRRGSFLEWFANGAVLAHAGRSLEVAQANCSMSVRGALRGIHFSDVPPGQAPRPGLPRPFLREYVVGRPAGQGYPMDLAPSRDSRMMSA
jgi:dTDP-4-dehydrorhamnose 3,5-epimerase